MPSLSAGGSPPGFLRLLVIPRVGGARRGSLRSAGGRPSPTVRVDCQRMVSRRRTVARGGRDRDQGIPSKADPLQHARLACRTWCGRTPARHAGYLRSGSSAACAAARGPREHVEDPSGGQGRPQARPAGRRPRARASPSPVRSGRSRCARQRGPPTSSWSSRKPLPGPSDRMRAGSRSSSRTTASRRTSRRGGETPRR